MRVLIAATLALLVALAAAAPHLHLEPRGSEPCAACLARSGEVARPAAPELVLPSWTAGRLLAEPADRPVTGAPLGAIPGHSPPAA